jgi:hypothetical protein
MRHPYRHSPGDLLIAVHVTLCLLRKHDSPCPVLFTRPCAALSFSLLSILARVSSAIGNSLDYSDRDKRESGNLKLPFVPLRHGHDVDHKLRTFSPCRTRSPRASAIASCLTSPPSWLTCHLLRPVRARRRITATTDVSGNC